MFRPARKLLRVYGSRGLDRTEVSRRHYAINENFVTELVYDPELQGVVASIGEEQYLLLNNREYSLWDAAVAIISSSEAQAELDAEAELE